jgi:hypothetical protein
VPVLPETQLTSSRLPPVRQRCPNGHGHARPPAFDNVGGVAGVSRYDGGSTATPTGGADPSSRRGSTHRCRIYGYGGAQLLDAAGAALHTRQERSGPRPALVTLRPGDRAYSALYWIHSPEAAPCSNAAFLQVIPPDETEPIRARFAYGVCGNGVLNHRPYQPNPT